MYQIPTGKDGLPDYDPTTCKRAVERFLVGDSTYSAAAVAIAETGDGRNLDYWIERYFEEEMPEETEDD